MIKAGTGPAWSIQRFPFPGKVPRAREENGWDHQIVLQIC
jgi:hypothetical protein